MFDKPALFGFSCDEGVRRNNGRTGARGGPDAIRYALHKLSRWSALPCTDAGTVRCEGKQLEAAQAELAERIAAQLAVGNSPIVLGGGHEVAWGSYQGICQHLAGREQTVGIINFDAHFDLRDPVNGGNSGTPFRQIAEHCDQRDTPFRYMVLGINPAMNGQALFDYADERGVQWTADVEMQQHNLAQLREQINEFVDSVDSIYLSICLDVFPAAQAPGVSAPGVPGVCAATVVLLLQHIVRYCGGERAPVMLMDIAEMNPEFDRDGITARLAARLIYEVIEAASTD